MRQNVLPYFIGFAALLTGCSVNTSISKAPSTAIKFSQDFDSATSSYKLNYSLDLGADPSLIDFIELREIDTTVYPNADLSACSVGIPVKTWNSPFTAYQTLSGFYLSGSQGKFRYSLCQKEKDGSVIVTSDSGVTAAASALGNIIQSTTYTATKVTSGQYFTCALFSNGRIKCWGNNQYGQLGLGDTSARGDGPNEMGSSLPYVDLGTSSNKPLLAIDVEAGLSHVCALMSDGSVKCWGRNQKGQLGLGDTSTRGATAGTMGNSLPRVDLGTGLTAKSIAVGGAFTCALLNTNDVKCWGDNDAGELGRGNVTAVGTASGQMGDHLAVINLGAGRSVKMIDAGLEHVCAILDANQVKCWGINDVGELGLGDTTNRGNAAGQMGDSLPAIDLGTTIFGLPNFAIDISVGTSHACVLTWLYQFKCWGDNFAGQLGIGSTIQQVGDSAGQMGDKLPQVDFGSFIMSLTQPVVKMEVGFYTTCTQLWTSEIKCWGANNFGQLGIGSPQATWGTSASDIDTNLPSVDIGTSNFVKMFSSQYGTTCAITQDSVIKCWGINTNGALGYGDTTNRGSSSAQMGTHLPIVDL
jgi:alpha-tubulin suppressor-like RCC1 family protein